MKKEVQGLKILPEYKRLIDESEEAYKIRICSKQKIIGTWNNVAEILNEELGYDYGESKYRKPFQEYMRANEALEIVKAQQDGYMSELETKTIELKKARLKLNDESSRYQQMLREQSRYEIMIEKLIEAAERNVIINVPKKIDISDKGRKEGIAIYADTHFGADFKITGLFGETLNEYNEDVFQKRMWLLAEQIIAIVKKEGFKSIRLFDLGDSIEGILRISSLNFIKYGVIDSSIMYAKFLAEWLNTLSHYVFIEFYSTEGNHDSARILTGKKGDLPNENVHKYINCYIEVALKDNPNIHINAVHDSKHIFVSLFDGFYKILATHGEEGDQNRAIREYSDLFGVEINLLIGAHKHFKEEKDVSFNRETMRVQSILGINDFSMQILKSANPGAKFIVIEEGKGKTIDYSIKF